MTFIGLLVFFILAWYPLYKYVVFPALLRNQRFRDTFEITQEKEEAFKMGLGSSGLSSGFWLFYFLGFTLIAIPTLFITVYVLTK